MRNTVIAVDNSGSYRVYITVTTKMVQKAMDIHGTTPTTTAALGRAMTAAGMMGLMLKSENAKLTLQIKGDGPAKEILCCSNEKGHVKAYVANPYVDLPLKANGHLDVGGAIGRGTLTVIKDLGMREPYVGKVDLVSGEIAEDITQYFTLSEQQPSSVALGVRVGTDGNVETAGGMIIQVLPDAKDEAITAVEDALFAMDALTLLIGDAEQDPYKLLDLIFKDVPEEYKPRVLEEKNISWHCDCSKDRMAQAIVSIGEKDLREIIEEDGKADITCSFCQSSYHFSKPELNLLLKEAMKR